MNWMLLAVISITFDQCNAITIKGCHDKRISTNNKTLPKLIEVDLGVEVILYCDYCGVQESNSGSKLWYYRRRGLNDTLREVGNSIRKPFVKLNIIMTVSHVLIIKKFQADNIGIYYCKDLDTNVPYIFSYILDVGLRDHVNKIVGPYTKWLRFERDRVVRKNNILDKEVLLARNSSHKLMKVTYKIKYCWEDWRFYDISEKRNTIRKKLGKCCLHPVKSLDPLIVVTSLQDNKTSPNILDLYDILCRSVTLNETHPKISSLVRNIPDFELTEMCTAGTGIKNQLSVRVTKRASKPRTIIKKIPEYGHLTLPCVLFPYHAKVEWYKNNKLLNDTFRKNMANDEDRHIFIDTHNNLLILHATKNEHGIYTCICNGVTLQRIDVRIITHSKLLNQEFFRYSRYLGFVLSLTVTCYCAGIFVAWHRRTSFADPLNIMSIKRVRGYHAENERLLQ